MWDGRHIKQKLNKKIKSGLALFYPPQKNPGGFFGFYPLKKIEICRFS